MDFMGFGGKAVIDAVWLLHHKTYKKDDFSSIMIEELFNSSTLDDIRVWF